MVSTPPQGPARLRRLASRFGGLIASARSGAGETAEAARDAAAEAEATADAVAATDHAGATARAATLDESPIDARRFLAV